jgi:hypothetical protein
MDSIKGMEQRRCHCKLHPTTLEASTPIGRHTGSAA